MYKELQDKKQNALLLSLREQQDLYMAAANKKGPDSLKPLPVSIKDFLIKSCCCTLLKLGKQISMFLRTTCLD
jgi:hypothetical protein